MNKNIIIVAIAILAMLPPRASAKEDIDKAIEKFVGSCAKYVTSAQKQDMTSESRTYVNIHHFKMPVKYKKEFDRISEAFSTFMKDKSKRISLASNTVGKEQTCSLKVYYGEDMEKCETYVMKEGWNYKTTLHRDFTADMTHAYILIWNIGKDSITGSVGSIDTNTYAQTTIFSASKDRKYMTIILKTRDPGDDVISTQVSGTVPVTLVNDHGKWKKIQKTTQFVNKQGSGTDSLETHVSLLKDLKGLETLNNLDLSEVKVYAGNGLKGLQLKETSADSVANSIEFMERFSNLRITMVSANKLNDDTRLTVCTGIVNKIVALCKQFGNLLDRQESEVCIAEIKKMKANIDDQYLCGLLGIAETSLKQRCKSGKMTVQKAQ